MDIRAESDLGETYDVEMQRGSLAFFENRALAYGARMVNSSLAKGDNYDKIRKNIVISFIDGLMFPSIPDLHTEFNMRERKWNISLTDRLSIHFLELGKVDDHINPSDLSSVERFCAYLKYAGDETKEDFVKELLETGEEAIVMSEHVFRKITEDESLQDLLRRQEFAEHDNATRMMLMEREATKRGLERGLEKGLEQGLEKGLEQGIAALILDNMEDGKTREQILDKLQRRFNLDNQKAADYYNKYSR